MKLAFIILGLAAAVARGETLRVQDEWSDVVGGVRGRLVVIYHPDSVRADVAIVCLELQNLEHEHKEIRLDRASNLGWRFFDERGNAIPDVIPAQSLDGKTLEPLPLDRIVLPADSRLRFTVRRVVRKGDRAYYLSAVFSSFPSQQSGPATRSGSARGFSWTPGSPWRGNLWLPKVTIEDKR